MVWRFGTGRPPLSSATRSSALAFCAGASAAGVSVRLHDRWCCVRRRGLGRRGHQSGAVRGDVRLVAHAHDRERGRLAAVRKIEHDHIGIVDHRRLLLPALLLHRRAIELGQRLDAGRAVELEPAAGAVEGDLLGVSGSGTGALFPASTRNGVSAPCAAGAGACAFKPEIASAVAWPMAFCACFRISSAVSARFRLFRLRRHGRSFSRRRFHSRGGSCVLRFVAVDLGLCSASRTPIGQPLRSTLILPSSRRCSTSTSACDICLSLT